MTFVELRKAVEPDQDQRSSLAVATATLDLFLKDRVEGSPVADARLCGTRRAICVGDDAQRIGRSVVDQDKPHAAGDRQLPIAVARRNAAHCLSDAGRERVGLCGVSGCEQDRKLIAADPGDPVSWTQQLRQYIGDTLEHGVARRYAVGIAEIAQPVEINQHKPRPLARALAARHLHGEVRLKRSPIAHTRKRVAQRTITNTLRLRARLHRVVIRRSQDLFPSTRSATALKVTRADGRHAAPALRANKEQS